METIIFLLAIGAIAVLTVLAHSKYHKFLHEAYQVLKSVKKMQIELERYIEENRNTIVEVVTREHKATRKETQEIKTRLSHARKEHNKAEKRR